MLQLIDVRKSYTTGDFTQTALDGINLNFRDNEFVSVLGPSGSGKTTMLNIIGGLDHYDTGDLIIDGVSTKEYKDRDWDTYRNNRIGFVFQSYNLIPHQTILSNVELALTLSGVSKGERKQRAIEALTKVGLGDHVNKRPSQLSGGQMQRVAIARALINNPEILLADEPTGALDSKTSVQIMNLLTEIAKDRLVIMVTHNPELAEQYATRTVTLADGQITGDTDPFIPTESDFRQSTKEVRRSSMSFLTALALSFNNLMTKKGRTIMTAFAGSIGIIGIAAILALANGVNSYIKSVEEETLSEYPVQIASKGFDMSSMFVGMSGNENGEEGNKVDEGYLGVRGVVSSLADSVGNNDLVSLKAYLDSPESHIMDYAKAVEYKYGITPWIYNSDTSGKIHRANPDSTMSQLYGSSMSGLMSASSSSSNMFIQLPAESSLYRDSYEVRAGRWPEAHNEVVLVVSKSGKTTDYVLYTLGLEDPDELTSAIRQLMSGEEPSVPETASQVSYEDILGVTFKLVHKADCYQYDEAHNVWMDKSDDTDYMKNLIDNGETISIVGIIQAKPDAKATMLSGGLYYLPSLTDHIVDYAAHSAIVKQQLDNPDIDVFSGKGFDDEEESSGFDMNSLFSVDAGALSAAFNVNTSALSSLSIDPSSLDFSNIDMSGIDPSSIDMSGLPMGFMALLDPSDMAKIKVDPSAMGSAASSLATAYMQVLQTSLMSGKTPPTWNAFMQTSTAQGILVAGVNKMVDVSALDPDKAAAVQQYLLENDVPYLQQTITTALGPTMNEVTAQVSSTVSAAAMSTLSKLPQAMQNLVSINPGALASAFQFNMDEKTMSELFASMMTGESASYAVNLNKLGYAKVEEPTSISIYPIDFESKEHVLGTLDGYNDQKRAAGEEEKIVSYTDIVGTLMSSVTTIIGAITAVLIAFVGISLVVSSIMIGIITYISVLERRKEIGILRAIGASKGNISQVFNAETVIVGLLAGLIGVGLTAIACFPVSYIVEIIQDVPNVMQLPVSAGIILILISVFLTFIGGLIPARSASRKDPVEALRSE